MKNTRASVLTNDLTRRQLVAGSAVSLAALALFGSRALAAEKAASASADQSAAAETPVVNDEGMVLDMNGDPCCEAGSVTTVLTVNSVATEMVLMLGGEGAAATLGQGFVYTEGSLNQAMYPNLADVPTFTRDDCTVENVAAIGPDLVICDMADTIEALRNAGINVAYGSVVSPETIVQTVKMLGAAMGGDAEQRAASYAEAYEQAQAEVADAVAGIADEDRTTVLYLRGIDSTCGAKSMPDNWITTAGGVNVATELGLEGSRAEITLEAIMDADPQVIVCESPAAYADVTGSAALAELQAIKNERICIAPLGPAVWSMGSCEALLMLYWAANTINPEVCDFDIETLAKGYFLNCYGYEISDELLTSVLNQG